MQEILSMIHSKVGALRELKAQIEKMVAPIREDRNFHKIASDIIPENLRTGAEGYEFLKILFGEKLAKKLLIRDPELDKMAAGEGI